MAVSNLDLILLPGEFQILQFAPDGERIPRLIAQLSDSSPWMLVRTATEVSLVCRAELILQAQRSAPEWRCFKVAGPLEFSATGILAELSRVLAERHISLFAASTFDTDYFLVGKAQVEAAMVALSESGWNISSALPTPA